MKIPKIKILVFEKSFLIKQGIISIVNDNENCELIEDYSNSLQFHSAVKLHQPQIVFSGFDLLAGISETVLKKLKNEYQFILIGIHKNSDNPNHEFIDHTIDFLEEKSTIFETISKAVNVFVQRNKTKNNDNQLSDREKDIVALVAKGLTNKEIANQLFISIHTVITHRKNIGRKLGIKSASGITVYAILNKLIEMKDLY